MRQRFLPCTAGERHVPPERVAVDIVLPLLAFPHEVITGARTILKQVVPPMPLRHNQAAVADLQNIYLMHARREGNCLGQPYSLAAIAGEYCRARHGTDSMYIELAYKRVIVFCQG